MSDKVKQMANETKLRKTGKGRKPTVGSQMASKLRSQCNNLTREERSTAYSRAMTRIYRARAQHTARA
jgi:hypothetical protein